MTRGLGAVRGRGLLLALDLGLEVVNRARARGLLVNAPRAHLLRFIPALSVTREEIDEAITRLDAAVLDALD